MHKTCPTCGKPATYQYHHGRIQCGSGHELCRRCWRDLFNSWTAGQSTPRDRTVKSRLLELAERLDELLR